MIDLLSDEFVHAERLTKKEIQVALKGVTPLVTEQRLRWVRVLGEAVPVTLSEQEGYGIA